MKRTIFAGAAVVALLALPGPIQAGHKHYGSVGFQFGFYRQPAPSYGVPAAPGYSYGYAPSYSYAPAAPLMAPAAPLMAPAAPLMAPAGGCSGSGYSYGYSPGYSYSPSYGYSTGYGYSAYGTPQAGLLFPGGSILDVLRMVREFKQVVDELRGGQGQGDPATKEEIQKLRADVEALRKEVKAIEVPRDLDKQIEELKQSIDKQRGDFEALRKYLKSKDSNIP